MAFVRKKGKFNYLVEASRDGNKASQPRQHTLCYLGEFQSLKELLGAAADWSGDCRKRIRKYKAEERKLWNDPRPFWWHEYGPPFFKRSKRYRAVEWKKAKLRLIAEEKKLSLLRNRFSDLKALAKSRPELLVVRSNFTQARGLIGAENPDISELAEIANRIQRRQQLIGSTRLHV